MCKFFWGRFKIQSKSCCYPGSFADFRVSKCQIWPKQKIQICTNGVELIAKWTKVEVSVPMLKCGSLFQIMPNFVFRQSEIAVLSQTPPGDSGSLYLCKIIGRFGLTSYWIIDVKVLLLPCWAVIHSFGWNFEWNEKVYGCHWWELLLFDVLPDCVGLLAGVANICLFSAITQRINFSWILRLTKQSMLSCEGLL